MESILNDVLNKTRMYASALYEILKHGQKYVILCNSRIFRSFKSHYFSNNVH